jgi:hypothetical protein
MLGRYAARRLDVRLLELLPMYLRLGMLLRNVLNNTVCLAAAA